MEILMIILLTLTITTSFFIIRNLIKKNENQEDVIKEYEDFISKQSEAIIACDIKLKEVDEKGMFYADDQIGFFFKEVKNIQEALNEFTVK